MIRNILLLLVFGLVANFTSAQDTTSVQVFTFDDITKRRSWVEFPSGDEDYRKIKMNYTLKCDAATTQDNFACGEWDYTTYTDIYRYENIGTPYFRLGNQVLDSIPYVEGILFDQQQFEQESVSYGFSMDETSASWGTSGSDNTELLRPDRAVHRAQYLYTADELNLEAGDIQKMAIELTGTGAVDWLTIRLGHTDETLLLDYAPINEGLSTVYQYNTAFATDGEVILEFPQAFDYDGASNLIVDISMHTSDLAAMPIGILTEDSGDERALVSQHEDRYLDVVGDRYVEVPPAVFEDIDEEITISFWAYGNPETMPFNTWVLEGVDDVNRRVVNVHLPWSNGRVYWDAGHNMSSNYDRIDIDVAPADFAGRWTHWAFVKDANAGTMEMYIDGELLHSGTAKTRSMAGIARFKLGGRGDQALTGHYDGGLDEFRVWSAALSQAEIQDYMHQSISSSHPQYASLEGAYAFDEPAGYEAMDYSVEARHATLMGVPTRKTKLGAELSIDMVSGTGRPLITLFQNSGAPTLSTQIVTEPVQQPVYSLVETIPYIDQAVSGMSYTYVDTSYVSLPGTTYVYAPDGTVVSSEEVAATATIYNSFKQYRHQLQNYVTPYGIGLSLGPNGFRWEYEVTDYRLLFDGLVEIAAGNQQELIDLEFEMIEGTPPRDPMAFETIWLGDYQHDEIADDVVLPAVDRTFLSEASEFMLRTRTTGHWFGGFNNCAEFCPKYFNIKVDGTEQFNWLNWKTCPDNPVIGQGGTWIYDRAGWCPATFADTYDHEITDMVTPGGTHSIDFGMQAYPNGGGDGNYRTTLQLMQYGPKNFQLDLELNEIIAPNEWEFFNRYNPICADPTVRLRNLGAETITSAQIIYSVSGGEEQVYNWTGSLDFKDEVDVVLPIADQSFWSGDDQHIFSAAVSMPNGMVDEHTANDVLEAGFEVPELVTGPFFIWFRSNNAPNENKYTLYDADGNVVFERDNMEASTTYRDTMLLDNGCYYIQLEDTGGDGLSFFANNDGSGYFRLRYVDGPYVDNFDPDFGSFINYHFTVDNTVGISDHMDEEMIQVSPNPSAGAFFLTIEGYEGSEVQIEVLDAKGSIVYQMQNRPTQFQAPYEINLRDSPEGIYFARILIDGRQVVRRLIKE